MKAGIMFFTDKGSILSEKMAVLLAREGFEVAQYGMAKYCRAGQQASTGFADLTAQLFAECKLLIYVGAVGIAVRYIAPCVKDKKTDPAVISIDERGKFAIALLSGHIGGANRITERIAKELGSVAVVTTATDINGLLAVDEWSVQNKMLIGDMHMAKKIAASLVDGERVGLHTQYPIEGELPKNIVCSDVPNLGIVIADNYEYTPYTDTLFLQPQNICVGIGCRRGTPCAEIESFVFAKLQELGIERQRIVGLGSVDLKKDEQGLLEFARKNNLPIEFYSSEELAELPGEFTTSEFVRKTVGVDNVCERSAVKLGGVNGNFVLKKTAQNGITMAIIAKEIKIKF